MNLERNCQLIGWVLFIICSFFYLISGMRTEDQLIIWGSVLFLTACLVFMVPLVAQFLFTSNNKK